MERRDKTVNMKERRTWSKEEEPGNIEERTEKGTDKIKQVTDMYVDSECLKLILCLTLFYKYQILPNL